MARRFRREKARIIVFLVALLVLGVAVIFASHRGPVLVLPSEPAEIRALRAEATEAIPKPSQASVVTSAPVRKPAGNAFPVLMEAVALLPEGVPPREDVEEHTGQGDIARFVDILDRRDDDPVVEVYVRDCDEAIQKVRQALEMPVLIFPEAQRRGTKREPSFETSRLFDILLARALFCSRASGDDAEALRCYLDAVRLRYLFLSDGNSMAIRSGFRLVMMTKHSSMNW